MHLAHQSNVKRLSYNLEGYKALVITTSQASLDKINATSSEVIKKGNATGVYASEITEPYYALLDAQMEVDVASIVGGQIPIEKLSLRPFVRTEDDTRFLKDAILQQKVKNSKSLEELKIEEYDIVFLSGGWGAAYDFTQSDKLSALNEYNSRVIDIFHNHIVVDNEHLIITGQNQKCGVATAQSALELLDEKIKEKA
ncbi:MAG: putative intracellular protease/amidase [Chitinophagales bacterium]|jgi:putative intracellular protease/amidase